MGSTGSTRPVEPPGFTTPVRDSVSINSPVGPTLVLSQPVFPTEPLSSSPQQAVSQPKPVSRSSPIHTEPENFALSSSPAHVPSGATKSAASFLLSISSPNPIESPAFVTPVDTTTIVPPRQSTRQRYEPGYLSDYLLYNVACDFTTHHTLTNSQSVSSSTVPGTTSHPLTHFISDDRFSSRHRAFLVALTAQVEPKHYKEAVRQKVWNDAMIKEVEAQEAAGTWDIVTLPANKVAIGSQWVYKIKYNSDGLLNVIRHGWWFKAILRSKEKNLTRRLLRLSK